MKISKIEIFMWIVVAIVLSKILFESYIVTLFDAPDEHQHSQHIAIDDRVPIPIFIIVHDRLECLKQSVITYETQIEYPIDLVFHDSGTTFQPTLDWLKYRENISNNTVYHNKDNHHLVMESVRDYLRKHPEVEYYVITDPDVALDNVSGDILDLYINLYQIYNGTRVVGPMLRIDDIPDYYPLKKIVPERQWMWADKYRIINDRNISWKNETRRYILTDIDTTFQLMHRSYYHRTFPRRGIRCYAPYSARHLDWYLDPCNMTNDQLYYLDHARKVAHFGGGQFAKELRVTCNKTL